VFPGVDYVPVDLEALHTRVVDVCNERQLVAGDLWVNKILQLYQIWKIQRGLMTVGPSGTGKTNAWRVLLAALERLDGTEGVAHVIDPKAIHKEARWIPQRVNGTTVSSRTSCAKLSTTFVASDLRWRC